MSDDAVRPIVRHHHERRDGSGYPDGLHGDEIPLLAQIISVVDLYDAVTHRRPYQRTQSPVEAVALVRRQAAAGLRDPNIVETFASIVAAGALEMFGERSIHGICRITPAHQ